MQAKDLTQDDVGKWVMLRAKISAVSNRGHYSDHAHIDYGTGMQWLPADTILEFTDPPAPIQEIGDVFKNGYNANEWTIVAIVGKHALLTNDDDHISQSYPLNLRRWTLVRKGTTK